MKEISASIHDSKSKLFTGTVSSLIALALIYGIALLFIYNLEPLGIPVLAVLLLSTFFLFTFVWYRLKELDRGLLVMVAFCLLSLVAAIFTPPVVLPNPNMHSVFKGIYRSFILAVLIISVSLPALCSALYRFWGSTPRAFDLSRYPIIILPVIFILAAYGLIVFTVFTQGLPKINWELISTSYTPGTPNMRGILNPIIGTFKLMILTSIISLPIGVGAGIYMSEYGGRIANIINFSTTLLRSVSEVVLALAAFGVALMFRGTALDGILTYSLGGIHGTFLLASIFLSLLVIPVIAKATEEGMRSVPRDLREGSLAVGATEGYTLLHILLPWSAPNILTGLLLGCAEVAGCVTVIVLIAGWGQTTLSPLAEVTSLAFMIFRASFSPTLADTKIMGQYRYSAAAILLIITLGLTVAYLIMRNRYAERYRAH